MLHNDVDLLYERNSYLKYRGYPGVRFDYRHTATLNALVPLIDHENVIIIERKELIRLLGSSDKNINRTLERVDHLVRVYTTWHPHPEHPVKSGMMRIEINPAYGWRDSKDISRDQAIRRWYYTESLSELSKCDAYVCGPYAEVFGNSI